MEHLLTNKTASLTELRDPSKIIEQSGGKPVAIFNRNKLEGYFVPASAVNKDAFLPAEEGEVSAALARRASALSATVDYLKDK